MKLRTLIFGALLLVSIFPVGILAYWHHQTAVNNEFSVVENQHKVIARNLTIALDRYATDLRSAFQLTTDNLQNKEKLKGLEWHLGELYFHHVCSIDATGKIQQLQCALACPQGQQFSETVLSSLKDTFGAAADDPGSIQFSSITHNPKIQPAIYLVRKMTDGNTAIGEVSTQYFIELQRAVAFGEKGHAAIVDSKGSVIAHPKQDWMDSMKDLSRISVV
ncbi:MAG: cache domain-containing protein, partial [Gammaproteobacteria bacterium]|nr:cache domain-containing protein [Gammaproteobacteria bacterium]